jgi:hypothetical protein
MDLVRKVVEPLNTELACADFPVYSKTSTWLLGKIGTQDPLQADRLPDSPYPTFNDRKEVSTTCSCLH